MRELIRQKAMLGLAACFVLGAGSCLVFSGGSGSAAKDTVSIDSPGKKARVATAEGPRPNRHGARGPSELQPTVPKEREEAVDPAPIRKKPRPNDKATTVKKTFTAG